MKEKISWIFAGVRSTENDKEIKEEFIQEMLNEAFLEDKIYSLYLCGAVIEDKKGTLLEMEEGFYFLKTNSDEFEHGDYGIIYKHENAELLFIAAEIDENISGDTVSL